MKSNILKPLTVALGVTFALAAAAEIGKPSALEATAFDKNVSPCQNLFEFVNTNWLKANPIPADRTAWGSFEILDERSLDTQRELVEDAAKAKNPSSSIEQQVGDFYASGMDEAKIDKAGYAPIKNDLKRIDELKTPDEMVNFMRDYAAQGRSFLFGFAAQADFHNSSQTIGFAIQGGLGLPERDYYLKTDDASKKLRQDYLAHIQKSLELIDIKKDTAAKQAQTVLDLETRLAQASFSIVELRDPANQYHFVTLAEADQITPHFVWEKFLAAQNINGVNGFSLSQPKFFVELDRMIATVPVEQWHAYLRFHLVNDAAPYLSKAFVDENFAFYGATLRGQKEIKPRWKRVLGTVDDEMGMALGQLYVAKTFPPQAKQRALELVNNLRDALKARIEKLDWMSDATKKQALEKWSTFMPKIGYPDEWRDWAGLKIGQDSYFSNVNATDKFNHAWRMSKIGKPVDRKEWGITPQTVNAYYNPLQNEVVFPAAILQPPFFDATADDALNYGGIGAVIGHEMTHAYDDQGSQFDAQGNLKNWWTDEDKKQFEARTDKLVSQFDNYVAIDDLHVKGKQTLGENIADLGGLNVAYDALQTTMAKNPAESNKKIDGYTQDQRFFLNFARVWARQFKPQELKLRLNTDVHAPAQFRAIAAPSNMPAFAQSFQCKIGDPMVRVSDQQVKIW